MVTREPAVQRSQHKQNVFLVSSHKGSNKNCVTGQKNWILAQNMYFLDPKGLIWDHLGPNMADNCYADQLIGSVGLGARAVSRKTTIYFIFLTDN